MRFEISFLLERPEIDTRDYRRIFTSIIKSALSQYNEGMLIDKLYNGTEQKDFTWSVILNKPEFGKDKITLGSCNVKMLFSTYDNGNIGYHLFAAFLKIKNKKLPLPKGNNIVLTGLYQKTQKIIEKSSCIFSTVTGAPFVVREHNKETNKDKFYTSRDSKFNDEITKGLKRQAILAGFEEADVNNIKARAIRCDKNVVYNYGIYIDANTGLLEICAKPMILQYFYQAGILAHRSQCFGMLEVIAQGDI